MTQIGKAAVLVSTLGAVGGGVAVASGAFNKPEKQETVITISSKLASEGFDTNVTGTEWDTLFNAHNTITDGNIFQATSDETKNKAWLISKCSGALKKEDKDNTNYLLARQWCVKETTISVLFGKEGSKYKVLSVNEGDTTTNKNEWITKINSLKNNQQAKTSLNVQLNDDEAANIVAIKKSCSTVVAIKTTAKEFNEKFELAKQWCSV